MARKKLPYDPQGYAVNAETGTVHTRYAGEHAGTTRRTRTAAGVDSILQGKSPKVCRTCYPPDAPMPSPAPSPEAGQARRVEAVVD